MVGRSQGVEQRLRWYTIGAVVIVVTLSKLVGFMQILNEP